MLASSSAKMMTSTRKSPFMSLFILIDSDCRRNVHDAPCSLCKTNLGRLVHLTLLQMAATDVHTRFSAFEMIHSVVNNFISDKHGKCCASIACC